MSDKIPTLFQVNRLSPRMACPARIVLRFGVLFFTALFPFAAPSNGLLDLTESEAPVEQHKSSEEVAVREQERTRVGRNPPRFSSLVSAHGGLGLPAVDPPIVRQSGHRLANNFMAPLRC